MSGHNLGLIFPRLFFISMIPSLFWSYLKVSHKKFRSKNFRDKRPPVEPDLDQQSLYSHVATETF